MYKARTKLACQIAGIDPQRLNEAHHAQTYRCLPPTRAGSARVFEVHDIVALCVFKEMTDFGISTSRAADIACRLSDDMQYERIPGGTTLEKAYIFAVPAGLRHAVGDEYFVGYEADGQLPTVLAEKMGGGGDATPLCIAINIQAIRVRVKMALEAEAKVLGDD